jgi:Ca2+-binding EF-hand superfamily protein
VDKLSFLEQDLDLIVELLDADKSGVLEPHEFARTGFDLLRVDRNLDAVITREELRAWYRARHAVLQDEGAPDASGDADDSPKKASQSAEMLERIRRRRDAARLLERYDANRDGLLQESERRSLPAGVAARLPATESLSLDDLLAPAGKERSVQNSPAAAEPTSPAGPAAVNRPVERDEEASVPEWFQASDRNADGQVTMHELILMFQSYDANRDGIITRAELRRAEQARAVKSNPPSP